MLNPKTSDENLIWEKGSFQPLPFYSLIVIVKAYFITCFSPTFIHKECKKFNERQRVVLRDSKSWTQGLRFVYQQINKQHRIYIITTINNTNCKHKYNLSFSPSYSQFHISTPPENKFKVFRFWGVYKCNTGNKWVKNICFLGLKPN